MLFEKLLVPLDGTAESAAALPMARAMARATGATFTLLRVVPAAEDEQAIREARRELDSVAGELTAGGLTAKTVGRTGDPAQQIIARPERTRPT
jgi:nucleotide-binding universal stress UspA family protein